MRQCYRDGNNELCVPEYAKNSKIEGSNNLSFINKEVSMKRIILAALLTISMSFTAFAGQWQKDANGWLYQYYDGSYPYDEWIIIQSECYYFDHNGYMLSDTITPDGYQVDEDGKCNAEPKVISNNGIRCWNENASIAIEGEPVPLYESEYHHGKLCYILDDSVGTFHLPSSKCNINPDGHEIWLRGIIYPDGQIMSLKETVVYPLEYDREYNMDFTGEGLSAYELSQFCNNHDVTIWIEVVDKETEIPMGYCSQRIVLRYASPASIPTGAIG